MDAAVKARLKRPSFYRAPKRAEGCWWYDLRKDRGFVLLIEKKGKKKGTKKASKNSPPKNEFVTKLVESSNEDPAWG